MRDGKVEYLSYEPLMKALAAEGILDAYIANVFIDKLYKVTLVYGGEHANTELGVTFQ